MNGKQRDTFLGDILHWGIPTFSPAADEWIRELVALSSDAQREVVAELERWERGLNWAALKRWWSPPWIYLRDLDASAVATLEPRLRELRRLFAIASPCREGGSDALA